MEDEEFDLACVIRLCPEEFSVNKIMSSKDGSISTIRPGLLGKMASLWTIEPCFMIALAKEYSILMWLGFPIDRKGWNSISSLFCMLLSFPTFFVFLLSPQFIFPIAFPFYHYQA